MGMMGGPMGGGSMMGGSMGMMGGSAGGGDHNLNPPPFRLTHILGRLRGRTVRGKHAAFVRDFEAFQHLGGLAHDVPVRLTSHQDRD